MKPIFLIFFLFVSFSYQTTLRKTEDKIIIPKSTPSVSYEFKESDAFRKDYYFVRPELVENKDNNHTNTLSFKDRSEELEMIELEKAKAAADFVF